MKQDKGRKLLRNVKNYCGLISATLSIDILGMLLRRSLLVLITIFVFFSHAHALVFERRPRPDPELSFFSTRWQAVFLDCRIFTAWEQPFPELVEAKWILRPSVCAEKQNILKKGISVLNSLRYSISQFLHHA